MLAESPSRRRPEYCRFERNGFYSGEVMNIKIKTLHISKGGQAPTDFLGGSPALDEQLYLFRPEGLYGQSFVHERSR